jgi:hypothetical protein
VCGSELGKRRGSWQQKDHPVDAMEVPLLLSRDSGIIETKGPH